LRLRDMTQALQRNPELFCTLIGYAVFPVAVQPCFKGLLLFGPQRATSLQYHPLGSAVIDLTGLAGGGHNSNKARPVLAGSGFSSGITVTPASFNNKDR